MYKKTFFNEINQQIRRELRSCYDDADKVQMVLNLPNIIGVNSLDGAKYNVFVQTDIKKLARLFGIEVPDVICNNILETIDKIATYNRILKEDLYTKIKDFVKNKVCLKNTNFDFVDLYPDMEEINLIMKSINIYFANDLQEKNLFETIHSICKEFSLNIDLLEAQKNIENEIMKKIEEKQEELERELRWYLHPSEEEIKEKYQIQIEELRKINLNIKTSKYYTKETFAMLYVRLEEYVKLEKALNDFIALIDDHYNHNQHFNTLTIVEGEI